MMQVPITAIVVTYNSSGTIVAALDALQDAHDSHLAECIVVDNNSHDDTVSRIARTHPWVKVIHSSRNLGYGRGLNLGLRYARTPYVLFMNPDAVLPCQEIQKLLQFMESHPRAGLVAPALIEDDGQLQAAGGLPTPLSIVAHVLGVATMPRRQRSVVPGEEPFATDWLCGAILLTRRALMQEMGGFDPRFFLYFEETDLCRRVAQRGYELWAVGQAVAHHAGGVSAKATQAPLWGGCIAKHYFRSRFYYLAKHHGWLRAAGTECLELLLTCSLLPARWLCGKETRELWQRLKVPPLSMPSQEP